MIKIVELYESIPTYPDSVHILSSNLPVEAPLCEDDDGGISYISEEARKEWIRKLKRAEENRKHKEFFKKNVKPGDLYERISDKGTRWLYLAVEEDGKIRIKIFCKTKAGKLSFKQYASLCGIPENSNYLGIYEETFLGDL